MRKLLLAIVMLSLPAFATNAFTASASGSNAAIGLNGTFNIPNSGTLNCPNNSIIHVGAFAAFTNATFTISDTAGLSFGTPVSVNGSTNTTTFHWKAVCTGATADTITITCTATCTGSTVADGLAMWFTTTTSSPSLDGSNTNTSTGSLTLTAAAASTGDLSVAFVGNKNSAAEATATAGWTKRAASPNVTLAGFSNENSSGSVSVTVTGGSGQVAGTLINLSFGGAATPAKRHRGSTY